MPIYRLRYYLSLPKPNLCDLYLMVWVVYYLQGLLYEEGTMVSQLMLGLNLGLSIFFAVKVYLRKDLPLYFKGLGALLLMFTIYGALIIAEGRSFYVEMSNTIVEPSRYLQGIYISLLPLFPMYWFARNGLFPERKMRIWTILLLLSSTAIYIKMGLDAVTKMNVLDVSEVTNNGGYAILYMFPALYLLTKNKIVQYGMLAYIIILVVLSMKRGALLCCGICTIFYLIQSFKSASRKYRVLLLVAISVFALISIVVLMAVLKDNMYLMKRIEATMDGESSNRDNLYTQMLNYLVSQDIFHMLVGNGANSSLRISENYAHNDWLEIALNQGLLGISIYVFYFICFYRTAKAAAEKKIRNALYAMLIMIIVPTFFSMSYNAMNFVLASFLGYSLACSQSDKPAEQVQQLE